MHRLKLPLKKQWPGHSNPPWLRTDKKDVTVLYSFVERRKSLFFRAFLQRQGFTYEDLGDHVSEDVRWGKQYGNRMECNPMYFTSGALIRSLFRIQQETGLTKDEIVDRYVFLGGGGQCGPCRYGMYPQEYLKVVNEAGFEGFRILIFSSDLGQKPDRTTALPMDLPFRINMMVAIILADLLHVAECALRPYARDKEQLLKLLDEAEAELIEAFTSRLWMARVPQVLERLGQRFASIPRRDVTLPIIFVTGEFFSNLAHNDANYHLRRFITDEGAEVLPGLFTQRILYDNWRRSCEAKRDIAYGADQASRRQGMRSLRRQRSSSSIIQFFYNFYRSVFNPEAWGGRGELLDLDHLAELGREYYHPEIFGGEGNLEVAEAIHYADSIDGIISSKPFGCMASSGVSDGVMAKVTALYPQLNFLSIETSGDNEVSILGRVSMLVFKSKQKLARKLEAPATKRSERVVLTLDHPVQRPPMVASQPSANESVAAP